MTNDTITNEKNDLENMGIDIAFEVLRSVSTELFIFFISRSMKDNK